MADKFDRFTKRARQSLSIAQEEARRLNHAYIGTEHLLLGLMREEEGIASRVLVDLGLSLAQVRRAVERMVGRGEQAPANLQLADQTKRVIELAVEEAKRLGNQFIGTEHLLLAIVRVPDSMATSILQSLNVNREIVRRRVMNLMRQDSTPSSTTQQQRPQSKEKSMLEQLGVDLTELARAGQLDPVVGRQKEIERVIQILARRTKNNPALIGEPGVGKTAIVEGLAQRIIAGRVPHDLQGKRVIRLDVGSLVAGTMYRGQFEERLKRVIDEIKSSDTVLFIDELHMLVGAGAAGSAVDAANILKPALSRGELQTIGATTLDEYRKHIESDAALERRFQPVFVDEPSVDETIAILRGVRNRYEEHHQLKITDEALEAAARLAARYVPDRFLPDKAIDLVDEASSRVRVFKVLHEAEEALKSGQMTMEEGEELDVEVGVRPPQVPSLEVDDELRFMADQLGLDMPVAEPTTLRVTAGDIAEIVSMWTGVPVVNIAQEESLRLLKMEEELHKRIVGQDEGIKALAKSVRRARAGLKDPNRPIGSFIFLGPTGVGKTELCKALAEFMFGSEEALLQLDMSEFMERHSISRLVGAPPGYVGYEEAGQLTEAIRRRPYTVVVFDEIEKAHPEAFNILLQIMEEGQLTDAKGHKVDFRNTIIILTSNVGSGVIAHDASLGFSTLPPEESAEADYRDMKNKLMKELRRLFRPEFLNRVDEIVVFHELTREHIEQIVDIQFARLNDRLAEHQITVQCTEEGCELLVEEGFDPQYGARPLRRAMQRLIEDPLAEKMLEGAFKDGDTVLVDAENGHVVFRSVDKADEPARLLSGEERH
ncbi:MAG TPA: ATP-dependent Clp protease ATP-binding subunit [Chloroflexi bacterium]|jgi:ATP-dependent Clp protease ATP-binding subunit ClpC|nr:ATP-dependent Clp protease ATP-binding subunit [Chloroflexota bacterium]